jgi:hypothetical protein
VTQQEAALRKQVIEQVLGAVENRWIERCIRRAAEAGEDPVKAARQAAGTMGYHGRDLSWNTTAKGIEVKTQPLLNEAQFVIPWREVAETALGTRRPQQTSLF